MSSGARKARRKVASGIWCPVPSRIWGEAAEELVSNVMLRVENEAPGAMMALIADAEQRTLPQLGAAIDRALSAAARKGKGKGGGGGRGRGKVITRARAGPVAGAGARARAALAGSAGTRAPGAAETNRGEAQHPYVIWYYM